MRLLRLLAAGVLLAVERCSGCVCPPSDMTGVWGGIQLVFSSAEWSDKAQNGTITATTAGSDFSALGEGVGAWSGGYHYFKLELNFSSVGAHYDGQLDCTCDNLIISDRHAPKTLPKTLNLMANTTRGPLNWTGPALPPPAWVRNLSIYEINPRGITSPGGVGANGTCWVGPTGTNTKGGCGSGTWSSLRTEGIPHLQKLGITGLWVAGSGLADSHFFGIWSTYATVDPSVLDPALGPAADFTAMVSAAHAAGIKVFLDVTTHGLVDSSPLIAKHPTWFEGGKWSMTDFKYAEPEFLKWWVATWTSFVVEHGVDGFRLDGPNGVAYQSDTLKVWDTIAKASAAAGHEIAVFGEVHRYHFSEHDQSAPTHSAGHFFDLGSAFGKAVNLQDVEKCQDEFNGGPGKGGQYSTMMFSCHDAGWVSDPGNKLNVRGSRASLGYLGVFSWYIPVVFSGEEFDNEPIGLPALSKGLYAGGACCSPGQAATGGWSYGTQVDLSSVAQNATRAGMMADASRMFAIQRAHSSVRDEDVFFSAASYSDSDCIAIAHLTDYLTRVVLLLIFLAWQVLHRDRCTTRIRALTNFSVFGNATSAIWVPYVRWVAAPSSVAEQEMIVVIANNDNASAVTVRPALSPELLAGVFGSSSSSSSRFELRDLWAGSAAKTLGLQELESLEVKVGADLSDKGGLGVISVRLAAAA
jgi:glycosidase